jgi:crotonobetainyl-CoA:carnitine CoA-transferase CaiB-like acyl-CoA transferase
MSPVESSGGAHRADFLAGVRVLELGDGVAGASASSVLWALGADVTTVVDASSAHRRGRPRVETADGVTSLVALVLDRGKQTVSALPGFDDFDVVIVDRVGAAGPLRSSSRGAGRRGDSVSSSRDPLDEYLAFVAAHNRGAWVTISAFGLTGPRANDAATELTVAAASGMLAVVRDPRTGRPLKLAGQQSLLNTGQGAALAACHAFDLATARGGGVHLDVSAVEAMIAMGPVLEVGGLLLETGSLGGAKRYGSPADFYECTDGLVRISAMEDHQWQGVVAAMGAPGWTEEFASVESRIERAAEVDERVAAWTRERTKVEAETVLQHHGVPATAVYSPLEILGSPQLAHREAFEAVPVGAGRTASVVGVPFRIVAGGNERQRVPRTRRSLRGLRVVEASRVLAVPLCGAMLAALGADVTKLEDLPRLDMYRRRGPYIDGRAAPERSAYFALMNHSKRSAAFDVDAHGDRLDALVDEADVVIENLGRKRATALGISASSALGRHPDVLAITSSGFGSDGPNADHRAYAYNLQASCALGYLTRNERGESAEIDIAWADLISAYALATIIAAWAVGPAGNAGTGIDFAMADLIVAHFNEFVAAASLDPQSDDTVDRGNELAPFAPHGVYRTRGGWIAIAVDGDEQVAALTKILELDGDIDRKIDGVLEAATAVRDAAQLAAELRAVGVAAEAVASAADLLESPQLSARDFFTGVEHVEWGRRRLVGIPWREAGAPAIALRPPPLLVPES